MIRDLPPDPKPVPTGGPFNTREKHRNPIIAALWQAHDALDADEETARAAIRTIISEREHAPDDGYLSGWDRDLIVQRAGERGDEDGWVLATPAYRGTDTSDEANAYRDAYENAAADRVKDVLA